MQSEINFMMQIKKIYHQKILHTEVELCLLDYYLTGGTFQKPFVKIKNFFILQLKTLRPKLKSADSQDAKRCASVITIFSSRKSLCMIFFLQLILKKSIHAN